MRARRTALRLLLVPLLAGILVAIVCTLNRRGEAAIPEHPAPFHPTPAQIERGAYLALAGNCAGCHTSRGGMPYAGGRGIATPFGTVYTSNLTPDQATGIGGWSADHFWRALHNGRSRDGRLLYPAFPYPSYTLVTREDSDALYAYLRSLPPVQQATRPHELRFPYDTRAALAVWRALFFRAGPQEGMAPEPGKSAQWMRGAYLVRGLGHCAACHSERNAMGATSSGQHELGGGLIPMQNWYAPSLAAAHEAGVADWPQAEVVALLRDGVAPRGSVLGPMAEVVFRSTSRLHAADLDAIAVFLKDLPQSGPALHQAAQPADPQVMRKGAALYGKHCADCHGETGQGARGAYPALAGNRAVTLDVPANLVKVVLAGGFPPSTAGHPRPYGMPPFTQTLDDADVAAVLTYIRGSWGHAAAPVSALDVLRYRQGEMP
ncbi:MAG: c-type cytochrome [Aquabacterium sp.]|nr:MAG: c-type cytochrome [Aquabacterium sp.]